MKKGEVGIPAGPVRVFESRVPGSLESAKGIRFSFESTEYAGGVIKDRCLVGAKRNREVELSDGIVKTVDCRIITGKKNACARILRHMLEMSLQSSDTPLSSVAKRFLLSHHL